MTIPRVTIVIPTFGRAALLARAVESVRAQTMPDWELVVAIDGHDPATLAYLASLGDPRVRHIAHAEKRGPSATRNSGAGRSNAPWIAFLDDDDEWLPGKLELQLALAGDDDCLMMTLSHVVTPFGSYVWPDPPFDPLREPVDEWLFNAARFGKGGQSFLQTSSLMLPRTAFEKLRFRDTNQHEDWELGLRAVKQLDLPLRTVTEPLVVHYMGGPRRTQSSELSWANSIRWADEVGLLTKRAYSGFLLNIIAPTAFNKGDFSGAGTLLRTAFARGRPTLAQLFRFALALGMPVGVRHRLKALLYAGHPPAGSRTVE